MLVNAPPSRPRKLIWHGAGPWGDPATSNCAGWHSDDALAVGAAADLTRGRLLGQTRAPCNHKLIVLCVETDGYTMFST